MQEKQGAGLLIDVVCNFQHMLMRLKYCSLILCFRLRTAFHPAQTARTAGTSHYEVSCHMVFVYLEGEHQYDNDTFVPILNYCSDSRWDADCWWAVVSAGNKTGRKGESEWGSDYMKGQSEAHRELLDCLFWRICTVSGLRKPFKGWCQICELLMECSKYWWYSNLSTKQYITQWWV